MRIVDRFLLFVFSIGMLKISILSLLVGFGVISQLQLLWGLKYIYLDPNLGWVTIVVSFILFLLSCRFMVIVFKNKRPQEQGINQRTEAGPICISFDTIQSLALNAARKVNGVVDVVAHISYSQETSALSVKIRIVIDGQHSIKDVTGQVQKVVREQVEKITGISVMQVSVYVDQVIRSNRSRVRVQ